MPRLKMIEPSEATGKAKELFDGPLKDKQINIFKGMANSPAALEAYLKFNQALSGGELSNKEGEVIALAIGEANGCDYCTAAHTMLGKNAGLSDEQAVAARQGSIKDDPKLDALARFVTALHEKKGWVGDGDIQRMRDAGYSDGGVVEAIAHYALSIYTNYFNHTNETPVDFPAPPKAG